MTALSRKVGERLRIGDQVVITVMAVRGQQVQLKISAPESVAIWREESYQPPKDKNAEGVPKIEVCAWLGQTVLGDTSSFLGETHSE